MYDVSIIGSGPAGLTASIYTSRANLKTLVIAGAKWGGQLQLTTLVENFPGFPDGIQGPDLMAAMRKQAEHHGVEFIDDDFPGMDFSQAKPPFNFKIGNREVSAKAVLIATGADTKWLDIPGEKERIGRGVSSCAPCDAPFFRNKKVIVIGGGDSAMEEACVLTNFAEQVIIIYRKSEEFLRASKIMLKKVMENPKIKLLLDTEIEEISGQEKVEKVKLKTSSVDNAIIIKQAGQPTKLKPEQLGGAELSSKDNQLHWEMSIDGIFVAIGHIPNTKIFQGINVNERGFILQENNTHTNIEGVFVAGDVQDDRYMQAVTAAGFGCMAALDIEKWLQEK